MLTRVCAALLIAFTGTGGSFQLASGDSRHASVGVSEALGSHSDRFDIARRRPATWLDNSEFRFELPDLEGNTVSNGDARFRNKVVVYDVWGTWCPPCREMTPFLVRLDKEYAAKGLEVVGIAFEYEPDDNETNPRDTVARYAQQHDVDYLMLYGGAAEYPSTLVFSKLTFREFDGFPTVVIVGKDGTVARIEEGWDERAADGIESTVRELLALK